MKPIRLHEWVLTLLNQAIRADAEFQINQRNAWQELARDTAVFNGIDVMAGFQHQRSLSVNELTFELDLVPDVPNFRDKFFNLLLFRKTHIGSFYRLRKKGEKGTGDVHVRVSIKRDNENSFQSEVTLDPKDSAKPEDIQIVDLVR